MNKQTDIKRNRCRNRQINKQSDIKKKQMQKQTDVKLEMKKQTDGQMDKHTGKYRDNI